MKNLLDQMIELHGGVLGGSRALGLESKNSDWDYFFEDSEKYHRLINLLRKTNLKFKVQSVEEIVGRSYTEVKIKIVNIPIYNHPIIGDKRYDLNLVNKLLSIEEQLQIHIDKKFETLSCLEIESKIEKLDKEADQLRCVLARRKNKKKENK